mgnify:CR=1 FL=1
MLEVGVELHGPFAEHGRDNNHSVAGPNWEIDDHWQPEWNADPSRIRTDVYYLLSD